MSKMCCPFIAILIVISISIQLFTYQKISSLNKLEPTPQPSSPSVPSPTPIETPTPTPSSSTSSNLLFERNNIGACSTTNEAPFTLKEAHTLTKLQTWYSWTSNEITLDYVLKKGEQEIKQGVLVRQDCDPYQRQWCQAVDETLSLELEEGEYTLVADTPRICQNKESENKGFIFVYGR